MVMKSRLLQIALASSLCLVLVAPLAAQQRSPFSRDNAFRLLLGEFAPSGDSAYWDDKALDFTGDAGDFTDIVFVMDYLRYFNPQMALMFSSSWYEGSTDQSYLDYVDLAGLPIFHTTTLEIYSLTLGLVYNFATRDAPVVPYLGAGGGLYSWRLSEVGEFVDFFPPPPLIVRDSFVSDGSTLGYFALAGLDIPLGPAWSLLVEARGQWASDDLGQDFAGFGELDLSGYQYTLGFSWLF